MNAFYRSDIRAEPPPFSENSDFFDFTVPRNHLITCDDDGAWFCCRCTRENPIVHYRGKHPFRVMDCRDCNHVVCRRCFTSNIAESLPLDTPNQMKVDEFRTDGDSAVRYASICSECGLSHRAKADGTYKPTASKIKFVTVCVCSPQCPSLYPWLKVRIGSPKDWRENQTEIYMASVNKRLFEDRESANPTYSRRYVPSTALEQQCARTVPDMLTMGNWHCDPVSTTSRPVPERARTNALA
jgi:hypothetical protein